MTKFVKTIKNMINKNINSLLCEIDKKVNAMATLTPIIKSESEKIDETGRNSVIGKVLSFVEGKVEASAAWKCTRNVKTSRFWWGIRWHLNECIINDINFASAIGGAALIIATVYTPCTVVCAWLTAILGVSIGYINWVNIGCGGDGVIVNRSWNGGVWFAPVC